MAIADYIRPASVRQFFSETAHWNLLFFAQSLVSGVEKMTVSLFCRKLKNNPFCPKLGQIWEFWPSKNFFSPFFYKNRTKIISGKKSTFQHFYPLHDLPLPTKIFCIFFLSKNRKKIFRARNYFTLGLKWVTRVGTCISACFELKKLFWAKNR